MNHADTPEVLAEKIALSARDLAPEIDRERRLPPELVERLNEAGMLRATKKRSKTGKRTKTRMTCKSSSKRKAQRGLPLQWGLRPSA